MVKKEKVENNNILSLVNSILCVLSVIAYQINETLVAISAVVALHETNEMTTKGIQNIIRFVFENTSLSVVVGIVYMILNYTIAKKNKKASIALTVAGSILLIANIIYCIMLFN